MIIPSERARDYARTLPRTFAYGLYTMARGHRRKNRKTDRGFFLFLFIYFPFFPRRTSSVLS